MKCAWGWSEKPYVFGPGLQVEIGLGEGASLYAELVPFASDDGSGTIAGYSLYVDRAFVYRVIGTLGAAVVAAEATVQKRWVAAGPAFAAVREMWH